MQIRLVTINLAGVNFAWREGRCDALVTGLRALAPDVVCFQESTIEDTAPTYDQAMSIGQAIGLAHAAFSPYGNPEEEDAARHGGVATISRWPFRTGRGRRLPLARGDQREGRVAQLLTLETPGGDLFVGNTHFSWRPEQVETRRLQCEAVLGEFLRNGYTREGARAVLCGDLNATDDEIGIKLIAAHMQDAYKTAARCDVGVDRVGATWSQRNGWVRNYDRPDRRIDYVFVPRGVEVRRARVILDEEAPVFPSDHFGVLVELAWVPR